MRQALKQIADVLAVLVMLPAAIAYLACGAIIGRARAFPGWSQALSLLPGLFGTYLRRAFYRLTLPKCGAGSVVSFGTVFSHPTIEIGAGAYLGVFCCVGDVTVEDDVLIGSHVSIANGSRQHGIDRLDMPVREQPGEWPRVAIGRDTWIGDRAIVMENVGRHCVVGAGAVVTSPVPDFAIVAGCPARIMGYRTADGPRRAPDATESRNSFAEPSYTSAAQNG